MSSTSTCIFGHFFDILSVFLLDRAIFICYNSIGEVIEMSVRKFMRESWFALLLMLLCAVGITVTTLIFKQSWLRVGPMYVSLVISVMQTRAIRFAPLLGGFNAIWHGVVGLHYGLVASAMSCFFFSSPLQLITFWRWQKRKYGASTEFRKLSPRWRLTVGVVFAVAWAIVAFVLSKVESSYQILDNTSTLLGILVVFLTMFSFIEFAPLQILSGLLGITLTLFVIRDNPEYTPTLIYNVYSTFCVTLGTFSVFKLYKEQRTAEKMR